LSWQAGNSATGVVGVALPSSGMPERRCLMGRIPCTR
jgi:hypothetical protein